MRRYAFVSSDSDVLNESDIVIINPLNFLMLRDVVAAVVSIRYMLRWTFV